MAIAACSAVSTESHSFESGREIGGRIMKNLKIPPRAILAYATVYHDQAAFLQGLRESAGPAPIMIGCSVQGLMSRGQLLESAYVSGAMALGGEGVTASCAFAPEISQDTREKGRGLGRDLLSEANSRASPSPGCPRRLVRGTRQPLKASSAVDEAR